MSNIGKRRTSIRIKITLWVLVFAMAIVFVSWLLSNVLIKKFYVANTERNLAETYYSCDELFNESYTGNESYGELLGYIHNPLGAFVYIIDDESMNVYSSIGMNNRASEDIRIILNTTEFGEFSKDIPYKITMNTSKQQKDDFYNLVGKLSNGNIIIIRAAVAPIDSSIRFVTKIFVFISSALALIGAFIILASSKVFSKPVVEMANVAKRMTNMDFNAKVKVETNDEYGELGQSMNNLSNKLEQTISELKSANIRLEQDIQKREQLDDMRKEFLSNVSHELKTPIAIIQGYAEGLKDNVLDDPEEREYYCDVIIDEAAKMNTLVKSLLNLNELEFGNVALSIEHFNLNELISQVISAKEILTEDSNCKIEFTEADKAPIFVWADEFMIEQVLTNYITNAIHYVKDNGLIKVYYEMYDNIVRVNVFNEGNHIAEKDIDKVFIKFYKADAARTREYGGSGIGLSIVAATMEKHNRNYGVENVPGGVKFFFELDCAVE